MLASNSYEQLSSSGLGCSSYWVSIVLHLHITVRHLYIQSEITGIIVYFNTYYSFRSRFHQVFIPKLLSTALKEYTSSQCSGGGAEDASVMTSTVVQVLTYLSLQHSQEIKSNLLALFHVGLQLILLLTNYL